MRSIHSIALLLSLPLAAFADPRGDRALQHVYESAVAHTTAQGLALSKYDPSKSFFPIGVWGVVPPDSPGGPYFPWSEFAAAGFNTVWPFNWDDACLKPARDAKLQLVFMGTMSDAQAKTLGHDPQLLGNMWKDEPSGIAEGPTLLKEFTTSYKPRIKRLTPDLSVFNNDTSCFNDTWRQFTKINDLACQDFYPIMTRTGLARTLSNPPHDLSANTRLTVDAVKESKPVWIIVGAFDQPDERNWPFRYPTPRQLRAQVYAAVVSGATGIAYFTMDCLGVRRGGIVGISPTPKVRYGDGAPGYTDATPEQLVTARALWDTAKSVNAELKDLTPLLLSPTAPRSYNLTVDFKGDSVTDTPIRAMLKPHPDGGYVLLAVNVDDAVLDVTYHWPDALESANLMFENQRPRGIVDDGHTFKETFEPFDTHVYRVILKKQ